MTPAVCASVLPLHPGHHAARTAPPQTQICCATISTWRKHTPWRGSSSRRARHTDALCKGSSGSSSTCRAPRRLTRCGAGSALKGGAKADNEPHKLIQAPGEAAGEQLSKGDRTPEGMLAELFGDYEFNEMQLDIFRYLVSVMRGCSIAFLTVASVEIFSAIKRVVTNQMAILSHDVLVRGIAISNLAAMADNIMTSVLLWMAADSFARVFADKENELRFVFAGLVQLGVIFMQISTITFSLAVVQMLESAVRWPGVTVFVAAGCLVVALVRAGAMSFVIRQHTPGTAKFARALKNLKKARQGGNVPHLSRLHRLSLLIVGGMMLPFSAAGSYEQVLVPEAQHVSVEETVDIEVDEKGYPKTEANLPEHEYEFSPYEGQVVEVVIDAMRVAGLALALQAFSTGLLGITGILQAGGIGQGLFETYNSVLAVVDRCTRCALLFLAAGNFRQIITTSGHDIEHLLHGLGQESGLGQLFSRWRKIVWGVLIGKGLGVIASWEARTGTLRGIWQSVLSALPFGV